MICSIFRSNRKNDTYIYVAKGENEEESLQVIPEAVRTPLGDLVHVMDLDLKERQSLARVDIDAVRQSIEEKGLYIQMPPSAEELAALDSKLSRL